MMDAFVQVKHEFTARIHSRSFRIFPFGDLQMGVPEFRNDLWKRWKADAHSDPNAYLIGMGDYFDRFRYSIDAKIRHVQLEDSAAGAQFDDLIRRDVQNMAEELKPFRSKIIGLHVGHHGHTFMDGQNDTMYLCQLLKVKYLDFCALVQMHVQHGEHSRGGRTINIFSTHGRGGARTTHMDLVNLERLMYSWDCDIFLRGHSTRAYTVPGEPLNVPSRASRGELKIFKKQRLLVNTGGFMDSYQVGAKANYVERSNLPPLTLGYCVIEVKEHDPKKDGDTIISIAARTVTE